MLEIGAQVISRFYYPVIVIAEVVLPLISGPVPVSAVCRVVVEG
jgi:hypothetical protein